VLPRGILSTPARRVSCERAIEASCAHLGKTDLIQPNTDKHFLHTSVFLRHASGDSGEAEQQIETILTKAVVAKRRVWISSILFAALQPSMFVPGRFATLFELTRYLRSLATFVTPDPNIMLRAARLRDLRWQRAYAVGLADEKPMSLGDSIQIASALWVKEAIGVPDLEFLMLDEWRTEEARDGRGLSTVCLQDFADKAQANSDAKAAARLKRVLPGLPAQEAERAISSQVDLAPNTLDLCAGLGLTQPAAPGTPPRPRRAPLRTRRVPG
jgi:hypothetical protein